MVTVGKTKPWIERLWRVFGDGASTVGAYRPSTRSLTVNSRNETQFGENLVGFRTPIIELNSSYGTSALRDDITLTGSGSITPASGELLLSTGATASSTARLEAAEIGRYIPGYGAQIGIGVRVPQDPTGNQVARWGGEGADGQNGFYFKQTASGLFAVIEKDGAETEIAQADWNIDKLDGTGDSGITLDLTIGTIFQIEFTWYGYGQILFGIIAIQPADIARQQFIPCHSVKVEGATSITSPNLRVFAEVDNGGDASDLSIDVGGRQYSVIGQYIPKFRFTGEFRGSTSTSTTVIPLISFRRKDDYSDRSIKLQGYDVIASGSDHILQIRIGGTLTNESFGTPRDHTADETALEADYQATAITGGVVVWEQYVASGANANKGDLSRDRVDFDIPNGDIVTLCIRTDAGTGTIKSCFRLREEW